VRYCLYRNHSHAFVSIFVIVVLHCFKFENDVGSCIVTRRNAVTYKYSNIPAPDRMVTSKGLLLHRVRMERLSTARALPHTVGYATTNECYNERVFINKIWMLQRTQMLQRTRRNTIGRRSTRVRMTCLAFPLWLERQSPSLLSSVRFSYQFSSVICLFVQCMKVKLILYYFHTFLILYYIFPI
jgi:hypothetical protein